MHRLHLLFCLLEARTFRLGTTAASVQLTRQLTSSAECIREQMTTMQTSIDPICANHHRWNASQHPPKQLSPDGKYKDKTNVNKFLLQCPQTEA